MKNKILDNLPIFVSVGLIASLSLLCITIQGNYAVNGNISWLLIGAERLLQGQTMAEHIYETNPPLSLIIYIPHVLFSHLAKVPLPIGSFYVTFVFAILSIVTVSLIIKHYTFLKSEEKMGFIVCYSVIATITNHILFSEREHLMLLAIVPFMLAQFALMEKIYIPKRLSLPVFAVGALAFLVKPPYGLAPTIFLVARMIKHKSINPIKQPDFIALSTMTLLYLCIIFIFFYDYVQTIFPDLIQLYIYVGVKISYKNILEDTSSEILPYMSFVIFEIIQTNKENTRNRFIRFLHICTFLNIIPYYVQMKGLADHLLPAKCFFLISLCCSIMLRVNTFFNKKIKWRKTYTSSLTIIIPFISVLLISNTIKKINCGFPTSKDLRTLPVAKYLKEHCKQPCSFFSFNPDMEIMAPTAAIMGYEYASRFGSYWVVIGLLKNLQSDNNKIRTRAQKRKNRYARYTLEDMKYYKPSLLMITKHIQLPYLKSEFDFVNFFGTYRPLKEYINKHYRKSDTFTYDRSLYFKGTTMDYPYTLFYDVYVRKSKP